MANVARIPWAHADGMPDRVALRGTSQPWTYARLRERIAALAGALHEAGLSPGGRVLLVAPSVPEFAAAYYGTHAAGGVVVSANTMAPARELHYAVGDAGCSFVLAWHDCTDAARQVAAERRIGFLPLHPGLDEVRCTAPLTAPHPVAPGDTAAILYTSGTTGEPKGAELTHANLRACGEVFTEVLRLTPEDVFGTALPLFHVFGPAVILGTAMVAGASVSLLPSFDAADLLELVRRDEVTVLTGVPTMYNALLQLEGDMGPADVASLRMATSGGASLPGEVLRAFRERFGCTIIEGYGLTETSGGATFIGLDRQRKVGAVGIALPRTEVRIVGLDGQERAVGEVGEIQVRGPLVMKGYWRRPDATAEALRDGWLRTGDLGSKDADGDVRIVDRAKDVIIRGGYNVYPREVEEVLHEHPDVVEVAVVGVPDDHFGEEVAAMVALRRGAERDPDAIRAWAKERLSGYKVPRLFQFVDELPKGQTGKILKRAIDVDALIAAARPKAGTS
jgi:long-chain acyl-CoA synthetase